MDLSFMTTMIVAAAPATRLAHTGMEGSVVSAAASSSSSSLATSLSRSFQQQQDHDDVDDKMTMTTTTTTTPTTTTTDTATTTTTTTTLLSPQIASAVSATASAGTATISMKEVAAAVIVSPTISTTLMNRNQDENNDHNNDDNMNNNNNGNGNNNNRPTSDEPTLPATSNTTHNNRHQRNHNHPKKRKQLHVIFVHLDLGIGGAEQLILQLAAATIDAGHTLEIITTRCDPYHCFAAVQPPPPPQSPPPSESPEPVPAPGAAPALVSAGSTKLHNTTSTTTRTTTQGSLYPYLTVWGRWIPRRIPIVGATAFCSTIRLLYLAIGILARGGGRNRQQRQQQHPRRQRWLQRLGVQYRRRRSQQRQDVINNSNDDSDAEPVVLVQGPEPISQVIVLDVLPTPNLLFRSLSKSSALLYYCHFPDQLLIQQTNAKAQQQQQQQQQMRDDEKDEATPKTGRLALWVQRIKQSYRILLNGMEEWTMGMADTVLVNSHFTKSVLRQTFPSMTNRSLPVLYPALDTDSLDSAVDNDQDRMSTADRQRQQEQRQFNKRYRIVSINRFERKKNLPLLIRAVAWLRDHRPSIYYVPSQQQANRDNDDDNDRGAPAPNQVQRKQRTPIPVIMAGGYDADNAENVQHYAELQELIAQLQLDDCITLQRSVSDQDRAALLRYSRCVAYTPVGEHFGIVPIEAMYCGTAVVAMASGGPMETILHEQTGILVQQPVIIAINNDDNTSRTDSTVATTTAEAAPSTSVDPSNNDVEGDGAGDKDTIMIQQQQQQQETAQRFGQALAAMLDQTPEQAAVMGHAAHEHIQHHFGRDRLVNEWSAHLQHAIRKAQRRMATQHNRRAYRTGTTAWYCAEAISTLIVCFMVTQVARWCGILEPSQSMLTFLKWSIFAVLGRNHLRHHDQVTITARSGEEL